MGGYAAPLAADFHRFYGRSLRDMKSWGVPLTEVAAMAAWLPPDSACRRAMDPHWQRTPEIDLLREVEHDLRVLAWQNAASRTSPVPERLALPWDPEPEGTIKGDRMTIEEADEWLGWGDRRKALGPKE